LSLPARKLSALVELEDQDRSVVEFWGANARAVAARRPIVREGERSDDVSLLLTGWAYRSVTLANGKRQIIGLLLPGDLCDAHPFVSRRADHAVATLSNATVATIPRQAFIKSIEWHPRLTRALWLSTSVNDGISRRWLINFGLLDAFTRAAHLFCELWVRAGVVGMTQDGVLPVPLTQTQLAELIGVTPVHANRTLKLLRQRNLIRVESKRLVIEEIDRLMEVASFDPAYLQMEDRH
jgi:CRP-like cAMP-binding protein